MAIEKIKRFMSTQVSGPVDIEGLAKFLGLYLDMDAYLDPEISGQIELTSLGAYKISINKQDSGFRKRFTLAHEIGHYVLHRDLIGSGLDDNKAYRSTNAGNFSNTKIKPWHETEANRFAARTLMPSDLTLRTYKANRQDINETAKALRVSKPAMEIRIKELTENPW